MIEWIIVISLIVGSLLFLLAEFFLLPGITILGLIGIAGIITGIVMGYKYFGNSVGNGILIASLILLILSFALSFRAEFWERFSLKHEITAKVNEDQKPIHVGMSGITLSVLRPFGKVRFENGEVREVVSADAYIPVHTEVVVVEIEHKKITVTPKS
ncbi:MAG: NfeD family protein [Cytophagales bacterium]|nr:NfeD family protein [Cytophagales bacterium]MDW8383800.1 NfeD family protein [Flammeovirgaceae bacterium]